MEIKQHGTEQPMGQWRNQRRNKKKIRWDKWKWKYTYQNLWDTAKAVLREKFIAIQSYLNKQETSQINISNKPNLTPKAIRERRTKKPKVSRRKEIIKIRSEINEKELKETIAKITKTKSWFSEKINKIDKPLVRLTKKKRENTHINRIRNEKREVTIHCRNTKHPKGLIPATLCQ